MMPLGRPWRVLVVDDNSIDRRLIDSVLGEAGWKVQGAAHPDDVEPLLDAADALDAYPDIVLLDLAMPELDGFSLSERLRQNARNRALCIVAMSSWNSIEAQRTALAAGCDHFIGKPIDVRRFAAQLQRCFELSLDRRQAQ